MEGKRSISKNKQERINVHGFIIQLSKSMGQLIICIYMLNAGMENAKVVGWVLEMCVSDTATFFPCTVTGN